jgi:hypothetical protein
MIDHELDPRCLRCRRQVIHPDIEFCSDSCKHSWEQEAKEDAEYRQLIGAADDPEPTEFLEPPPWHYK